VATYHTEIQRYVLELTQDRLAALVAGGAIGWFYRQAERVYVPSASSGASVVERGVDPARVARFSRGVDTERFTPAHRTPRRRRRLAADGETIVLYVGRLSREKGVLELAAAFRLAAARRPDLRLVVVGEGPARAELTAALAGTRHSFEGELRGEPLATAYACADVFCMPSTTETFGQVIAEAAASGLPAVVVDRGAAPELVADGVTGLIAPPDAPAELAARVERLAAEPELRRRMGEAARRSAIARPGWSAVFDGLIAGYAELGSGAAPIAASPVPAERPGVVA
jgi:glycosyltransferase involved in cell wall biosynthesis